MKYLIKPAMKILPLACLAVLLPSFVLAQPYVRVEVNGTINQVDVEKIQVRSDGSLVVTINGQPRDIAKDQYLQAVGVKPAAIDQAQTLIEQGKGEEATALLDKVVRDLRYQSWDAYAGEKLAKLQLNAGDALQAKRTLSKLEAVYGNNLLKFFPFLEKVQWDVKVVSNDSVGLKETLTEVILSEDSAADRKARALIVRGDLKASRKDFKAAALDYLRANYFFGENPDIQAEALYKTASMFAKIGDTGRLRKYSTLLKEKYPDSEYNKEIGS